MSRPADKLPALKPLAKVRRRAPQLTQSLGGGPIYEACPACGEDQDGTLNVPDSTPCEECTYWDYDDEFRRRPYGREETVGCVRCGSDCEWGVAYEHGDGAYTCGAECRDEHELWAPPAKPTLKDELRAAVEASQQYPREHRCAAIVGHLLGAADLTTSEWTELHTAIHGRVSK